MARMLVPVLLVLLAWGSLPADAAPARIGVASVVENEVNGTIGGDTRGLRVGAGVFRNEVITTGPDSSAQLLFRDETSLTLGAEARLTLDRFVYDPEAESGDIAVSIGRGAFRFITGSADPNSYRINTPAATLGIRGTIVEGYLGPGGNGAIVVVEGSITVTLRDGTTLTLNAGEYLVFDANGNITAGPADWTGPTLDLDAGIRFVLDAFGKLLNEGGDRLPRWREFNDALDSRDLDITFPPPEPDPGPCPHLNGDC